MIKPLKSIACIAKSYDGESRFLYIDSYDEKSVALKPMEGGYNKSLWFPREIVFEADRELFEKLEKAYMRGDRDALSELWSQAKPWKPE